MACTQTDQFRVNLCQPDRHEFFNIRFMDLNAAMPHTDAYRLADGIHFNAAVYAKWAELAAPYMLNGKQQSIHSNPQSLLSPVRLW